MVHFIAVRQRHYSIIFLSVIILHIIFWNTILITETDAKYPFQSLSKIPQGPQFSIESLRAEDYGKIIDLENFKFDVLNLVCIGKSPLLLILISSAVDHFVKRSVIRKTWCTKHKHMECVFVLGKPKTDVRRLQNTIQNESSRNKDIIQGNFIDAYENMTYKHISALKYAIYHCAHARYIMKVDDDIVLYTKLVLNYLNQYVSPHGAENLIGCKVLRKYLAETEPVLNPMGERVGDNQIPISNVPPFCKGSGIIYSLDVVFKLYVEAQKSAIMHENIKVLKQADHVFITGYLAKKTKVQLTNFSFIERDRNDGQWRLNDQRSFSQNHSLIFFYISEIEGTTEMIAIWEHLKHHRKMT